MCDEFEGNPVSGFTVILKIYVWIMVSLVEFLFDVASSR